MLRDCNVTCEEPAPQSYCVIGECGATCLADADCDDSNEHTTDVCMNNCTCENTYVPYCGDNNLDAGEQCDDGNNIDGDGCSANCTWEDVECEDKILTLDYAQLDTWCGGDSKDVTFQANFSDDIIANQGSCSNTLPNYIFMDWYNVTWANLTNATAYIEHKDIKVDVWLEYFDGTSWVEVCDLPEDNETDRLDNCLLDLNTDLADIKLRLAFIRTTVCHEELDHAYILATYCYYPEEKEKKITPLSIIPPPKPSGGGGGGGGGGGALGFTEWDCGEWSECIDGTQTRNCTLNKAMKTETQNCTVNKTIEGLGLGTTGGTGGTGGTGSTGGTQTFTFGIKPEPKEENVPLLKEKNDITGMLAGFSTGFTSAVTTAVAINWYAIAIILMIVFCLPLFFYFISKK